MKIIIETKDTNNIIGLKEDIVCRLEEIVDILRVDVVDDCNNMLHLTKE